MEKISAVYQIINTVTGDRYVGSSKDVKRRWIQHKCPSVWKTFPNKQLYLDMQKYGLDKFRFQILAPVMEEYLVQVEQEFIEMLNPAYNNYRAKGWNVERRKEHQKEYMKKYRQTENGKERRRKSDRKYNHQLCSYNGETLTLQALTFRFFRAGIEHPTQEAKKYLIKGEIE
jgi:group I intron endonuclease